MCVYCTHLASTTLVSSTTEDDLRTVVHCTKDADHIVDANGQKQATSIDKGVLGMFSTVRELLKYRGISKDAIDTITNSWRESTRRQYWIYIYNKNGCFFVTGTKVIHLIHLPKK